MDASLLHHFISRIYFGGDRTPFPSYLFLYQCLCVFHFYFTLFFGNAYFNAFKIFRIFFTQRPFFGRNFFAFSCISTTKKIETSRTLKHMQTVCLVVCVVRVRNVPFGSGTVFTRALVSVRLMRNSDDLVSLT